MIDNKITIKDDEKVNIQRGAIGHRSTWTFAIICKTSVTATPVRFLP